MFLHDDHSHITMNIRVRAASGSHRQFLDIIFAMFLIILVAEKYDRHTTVSFKQWNKEYMNMGKSQD